MSSLLVLDGGSAWLAAALGWYALRVKTHVKTSALSALHAEPAATAEKYSSFQPPVLAKRDQRYRERETGRERNRWSDGDTEIHRWSDGVMDVRVIEIQEGTE